MTCIVGLVEGEDVWMGCDSLGAGGYDGEVFRNPKVHRVGEALIGFTDTFRLGQILGYSLTVPLQDPGMPVEKYMATAFTDAVRAILATAGYQQKKDGRENLGTFMVGYRGRLFSFQDDLSSLESAAGMASIGCGHAYARGSLETTERLKPILPAKKRILLALESAQAGSVGVRAPFLVERLKK